jgi:hypothetical protein
MWSLVGVNAGPDSCKAGVSVLKFFGDTGNQGDTEKI